MSKTSSSPPAQTFGGSNYSLGFHFFPSTAGGDATAEQRFTFTSKGANPLVNYPDLWIRYKLFIPANYTHRTDGYGGNNKFMWLWSGNYNAPGGNNDYVGYQYVVLGTYPASKGDGSSALEMGWTAATTVGVQSLGPTRRNPNDADIFNAYTGPEVIIIDTKTDLNAWMDLVVHVSASTFRTTGAYPANQGGDGVLEIWKNGTKIWNVHNMGNNYHDPAHPEYNGFQHGYFLGWANSGFYEDTYMYIDNVEFAASDVWGISPAPSQPMVAFTTAAQSAAENAGTATITAQLSALSTQDVSVPFTVSGTATSGSDYIISPTGVLTIPAGTTSANIQVAIVDDTVVEPSETVVVTMGTPVNATIGAITSHTLTIIDNDPANVAPSITAQPAAATVAIGNTALFTVAATGTPAPTYQWRRNGTAISGATSASYTTPATVLADDGAVFSVVVSNAAGTVTSTDALLNVTSTSPPTTGGNGGTSGSCGAGGVAGLIIGLGLILRLRNRRR